MQKRKLSLTAFVKSALLAAMIAACQPGIVVDLHLGPDAQKGVPKSEGFKPAKREAEKKSAEKRNIQTDTDSDSEISDARPLCNQSIGGSLKCILDADEEFLRRPLPGRAEKRYAKWTRQAEIRVGQSHLKQAALVDNQRLLLVLSSMENAVRVYDGKTKKLLAVHPVEGCSTFERVSLARWPDSSSGHFYLIGKKDGIGLYSVIEGALARKIDSEPVSGLTWSRDRRVLIATKSNLNAQTSSFVFYVRKEGVLLRRACRMQLKQRADAVALSRDNRYMAALYYPSDTLELIDLYTGGSVWKIPVPQYGSSIAFSPDDTLLATGGSALMLVSTENPQNRVRYSRFGNNIDTVAFSPSGDAVAASSYDGRVRIFNYDMKNEFISPVCSLKHAGSANVYALLFAEDGKHLLSTSADRTVAIWGGNQPVQVKPEAGIVKTIRPRSEVPSVMEPPISLENMTPAQRRALLEDLYNAKRHRPALLDGPASPSRIPAGEYACRVSRGYRMRDCRVKRLPSGHTLLEVMPGNLIAFKAVLYNDGKVVRFEGWTTEKRPFKCFRCQERCFIKPSTCHCTPRDIERSKSCLAQPIHGVLKGSRGRWRGVLLYHDYHDAELPVTLPSADMAFGNMNNQFTIELSRR